MTLNQQDDDLVPVSVRLGQVVAPEDPEDWTRPLTWVVALGMLAGPLAAGAWFAWAAPIDSERALPGTFLVAAFLAGGAAATGATQIGVARAWTATLGAGLFGTLVVVVLAAAASGVNQATGTTSPALVHGATAALAGLGGAAVASGAAAIVARTHSRIRRFLAALVPGVAAAAGGVAALMR